MRLAEEAALYSEAAMATTMLLAKVMMTRKEDCDMQSRCRSMQLVAFCGGDRCKVE